jgi:putative sigma-54 modulation protein
MRVEITGRHIIITPAIRAYVLKRLRKFQRLVGEDVSFHVIIGVEKERHTAEILLKSKLLGLTGKGETSDMYASIVRAIEKLERQAVKHKTKLIETKRQRAKADSVAEKSGVPRRGSVTQTARSGGILDEEVSHKPMAVEEALLELGHSDYPFVVFRNADSGSVNVLYRRKDGSLGLINT